MTLEALLQNLLQSMGGFALGLSLALQSVIWRVQKRLLVVPPLVAYLGLLVIWEDNTIPRRFLLVLVMSFVIYTLMSALRRAYVIRRERWEREGRS